MGDFWDLTNIHTVLLPTQTDADSPGSQGLYDKMRWMCEHLFMLTYASTFADDSLQSLTTGANSVLTCAASSYTTDQLNGLTVLFTTGNAKGKIYTIDDTSTSTGGGSKLTLTGDNAYGDGARANDAFKILYDIVGSDAYGHSHSGTDGRKVSAIATDAVTADSIASGAVGASEIASGAVHVTELNTGGSSSAIAATNVTMTGGQYSFYPQTKSTSGSATSIYICVSLTTTSYATYIGSADSNGSYQNRYVAASGELHWIFAMKDVNTGELFSIYESTDHPCFGNTGDPNALPHPFLGFDPVSEIWTNNKGVQRQVKVLVANPTKEQVAEMYAQAKSEGLFPCDIIARDYEFDDSQGEAEWKNIEISVDLEDASLKKVKKDKAKKQKYMQYYDMKRK